MKKIFLLALVCAALCACGDEHNVSLTIFHTNDVQGFYWDRPYAENGNKPAGGFAVLKSMLNKREDPYLLFDCGDTFAKTQEGQLGKLDGAINIMNSVGYSAATLSASDFALGWDSIEPAVAKAKFPIILSNVETRDGTQPKYTKKYVILKTNGIRVAVLGVVSKADFPATLRNSGLQVLDEVDMIKGLIQKIKKSNPDAIIVLSSLGFELESSAPRTDERNLAEEIPEINLILGGNAEFSARPSEKISNTYITRAAPMLNEVKKTDIIFNNDNKITGYEDKSVILDARTFGRDEDTQAQIDRLRKAIKRTASRKIATLAADLKNYSDKPSGLGTFTAQCIKRWGHSDIGLINSDAFLTDLKKGPLTEVELQSTIPFSDRVMFLKMRGDEFKNALEHSMTAKNNWPQTAGLEVVYDSQAPVGQKIKKITINGQLLKDDTIYNISASDHIVDGGFGNDEFLNVFEFKNTDRTVRDIMRWCFYTQSYVAEPKPDQWIDLRK